MPRLPTWAGRSEFEYSGSVSNGTHIFFGEDFRRHKYISPQKYSALLNHFRGRSVKIGTSRDNPPFGSLGAWLQSNVSKMALSSYIGSVLLHEGYAQRVAESTDLIKFN